MQGTFPPLENVITPVIITIGGNLLIWGLSQYAVNHRERVSLESAEARELEIRNQKRTKDLEDQQKLLNDQMWEDRKQMRAEIENMRAEHRSQMEASNQLNRKCEEERRELIERLDALERRPPAASVE